MVAHALRAEGFDASEDGTGRGTPLAPTLRSDMGDNQPAVRIAMQVRRLTPTECERLQGFQDGYTAIPWRKKADAPDGPRYKALGNSMAVPCMAWIGKRIAEVDRGD
jgi:DNA (cytosine-5)-methyltransferase 1